MNLHFPAHRSGVQSTQTTSSHETDACLENVPLPESEVEERHVAVESLEEDALDDERRAVCCLSAVVLEARQPLCTPPAILLIVWRMASIQKVGKEELDPETTIMYTPRRIRRLSTAVLVPRRQINHCHFFSQLSG